MQHECIQFREVNHVEFKITCCGYCYLVDDVTIVGKVKQKTMNLQCGQTGRELMKTSLAGLDGPGALWKLLLFIGPQKQLWLIVIMHDVI